MIVDDEGSMPDAGGDQVCWLHRLCEVCGAMPTPEAPDRCWRCGAELVTDDTRDDDGCSPSTPER